MGSTPAEKFSSGSEGASAACDGGDDDDDDDDDDDAYMVDLCFLSLSPHFCQSFFVFARFACLCEDNDDDDNNDDDDDDDGK